MIVRACRYILAANAALLIAAAASPVAAQPARVAYVIDGDTFRLESGERIRIAGIDAPETQAGQAKCRAEIARGQVATRDARALLQGRTVTVERVGRSYNRTVANVRLGGRDVATMLVEQGIATRWPRGRSRPDWCRR
jgi:endonuclease YncB( thermonuclease family)